MNACPACTASMRDAKLHCTSTWCVWLTCGKCGCTIDNEAGTYWDEPHKVWGNGDGYLKATG